MAPFVPPSRARRAWLALLALAFALGGALTASAQGRGPAAQASPAPQRTRPNSSVAQTSSSPVAQAVSASNSQSAPSGKLAEPPKPDPNAVTTAADDEAENTPELEETGDESSVAGTAPVAGGNALARQAASVQKQLGRARARNGFFISSWFSDAPETDNFASAGTLAASAPEDCEPLDATIAEAYIRDSAKREGVSTDLIREVIRKESGFNPCAVSPKGAMGMMQLTAATAASLGVGDPYDPRQNIDGGVRLMKRLLDKYKGRPDLALAAYNAGEGAVDAHQGVPAYEETQEYVSTIMKRVFEEPPKPGGNTPRAPARIAPIPPLNVPTTPKAVER